MVVETKEVKIIHFKTYGCSHNVADSETMAQHLLMSANSEQNSVSNLVSNSEFAFGLVSNSEFTSSSSSSKYSFKITGLSPETSSEKFIEEADLIIYNTCTVKNPSDDKFFSLLKKMTGKKPLIIAGCISQAQKNSEWIKEYSAIGVDQLDKIVEVVQGTLNGEVVHRLEKLLGPYERNFIPLQRKNAHIAVIPILSGCLGNCSYCKTKSARGVLRSVKLDSVITQIRLAKSAGIKEIWLVSEDNGAYGLDIGLTFPDLLREISLIEGDFKVRIGMLNAEYAYRYRNELAELMTKDCFFKFLHIPIQAANNSVLKSMVRLYTIEEFETAVNVIREKNPTLNLATDIICGFPTETKIQWDDTMNFLKRFPFDIINISKFYPRPGTPAAKMQLIPTDEVKRRSKELTEWFNSVNLNSPLVGSELQVFFDDKGVEKGTLIGRSDNYKQVIVNAEEKLLGTFQKVKIVDCVRDYLYGELV